MESDKLACRQPTFQPKLKNQFPDTTKTGNRKSLKPKEIAYVKPRQTKINTIIAPTRSKNLENPLWREAHRYFCPRCPDLFTQFPARFNELQHINQLVIEFLSNNEASRSRVLVLVDSILKLYNWERNFFCRFMSV